MYLYTLTNKVTGLVYVGATTSTLPRRMGGHRQHAFVDGRQSAIAAAIREFGWDAFELKVLATTDDRDTLMRLEKATIKDLGTLTPNGYNTTSGGVGWSGGKHSDETRAVLSTQKLGKAPWNKGLRTGPLTFEHRALIGLRQRGRTAWNKGIPFTPEHKAKLIGKRMGAANGNARAIEFNGKQYGSISDAERALGLSKMQMKYKLRLGRAKYLEEF